MPQPMLAGQRLIAVFLAGLLLFYSPVIAVFDRPMFWFGIPAVYLYLFAAWAALIALMGWIVERRRE
ncbi:MAG: hypothetical protein U9Q81_16190 [Pseudomonadota bacterium]|nr:hypothetical protein [Pseudomonadota bacterium]